MSIPSGNGGYVQINIGAGYVTFHVGKWSFNKNPRNVEVTKSNNTSGTRYKSVLKDVSGTFELPLDAAGTAEAAGFVEGAELTGLKLKVGASALLYTGTTVTVDTVEVTNDNNQDVLRYRIGFKGGDWTGPA